MVISKTIAKGSPCFNHSVTEDSFTASHTGSILPMSALLMRAMIAPFMKSICFRGTGWTSLRVLYSMPRRPSARTMKERFSQSKSSGRPIGIDCHSTQGQRHCVL
jgi:hypothetical protein